MGLEESLRVLQVIVGWNLRKDLYGYDNGITIEVGKTDKGEM